MLGNSTVCTYCKGQAVSALSSGEAEYYGLVSAASQMLGLQSILLGMGNSKLMCGWTPQLDLRLEADEARTSETPRRSVPLGASSGH